MQTDIKGMSSDMENNLNEICPRKKTLSRSSLAPLHHQYEAQIVSPFIYLFQTTCLKIIDICIMSTRMSLPLAFQFYSNSNSTSLFNELPHYNYTVP